MERLRTKENADYLSLRRLNFANMGCVSKICVRTWPTWYERLVKKSTTRSTLLALLLIMPMSLVPRLSTLMPVPRRRKESQRRFSNKVELRFAQCGPRWA